MHFSLHKPSHPLLLDCIDYFLLIKNNGEKGFYRTFPNTNTCLALYKQSQVEWDRKLNTCTIGESGKHGTSKLFGFHNKPFQVNYSGNLEQVCILFKLEGLRFFTTQPINAIDLHDDPFCQLFGIQQNSFIQQLFSTDDEKKKLALLEKFLLRMKKDVPVKINTMVRAASQWTTCNADEGHFVSGLSRDLKVNSSTLYRRFLAVFGQSPIQLHKTLRFRKTLRDLVARKEIFTKTAYENEFYDQSHLIKDIRQFTGEAPGILIKKISTINSTMMMISEISP